MLVSTTVLPEKETNKLAWLKLISPSTYVVEKVLASIVPGCLGAEARMAWGLSNFGSRTYRIHKFC